jgi:hypothetical protein
MVSTDTSEVRPKAVVKAVFKVYYFFFVRFTAIPSNLHIKSWNCPRRSPCTRQRRHDGEGGRERKYRSTCSCCILPPARGLSLLLNLSFVPHLVALSVEVRPYQAETAIQA